MLTPGRRLVHRHPRARPVDRPGAGRHRRGGAVPHDAGDDRGRDPHRPRAGPGDRLWAAALSAGNVISPVLGGLVVKLKFGSDPNASWRWAFILVIVPGGCQLRRVSGGWREDSSAPGGTLAGLARPVHDRHLACSGCCSRSSRRRRAGGAAREVIIGFVVAAVFLGLFIVAEMRSPRAAAAAGSVRQPLVRGHRHRDRVGHVRDARHRLRHQRAALLDPGLLAAEDVDRLPVAQRA